MRSEGKVKKKTFSIDTQIKSAYSGYREQTFGIIWVFNTKKFQHCSIRYQIRWKDRLQDGYRNGMTDKKI